MTSSSDKEWAIETMLRQLFISNDQLKAQLLRLQQEFHKEIDADAATGERHDFERRLRLKDMQLDEQARSILSLENKVAVLEAQSVKQAQGLRSVTLQDEAMQLSELLRQQLTQQDGSPSGVAKNGTNSDMNESELEQQSKQRIVQPESAGSEVEQLNKAIKQLQQQLNETTVRLQDSEKFAADLQGYCDGVDKKLQETVEKRDSVIQMCEQLRHVFEAEQQRSAYAESELQKLNLEYSKLQAEYTAAAQSATDLMAREQNLQAQLVQTQEKLRHAEEAIGMYKDELMVKENEIEKLKGRLNCLLENVACLEEQHNATGDAEFVNRHRTLPRPSRGGNN